jgi:hypothetical protein
MNYQYLLKHLELFPYVIGITYKQFELLLPKFSHALRVAEHKKAYEKKRLRVPGGGRKPKLATDRQKLFFILFYYKTYPTFRFAQIIFELDKCNCLAWKEFLEPVLFTAVGYQLQLPKIRIRHFNHWFEVYPALAEFIVDGTERPIRRPKDPKDQTKYYSGKKKQHTVKNQIMVSPETGRILSVSQTVEGKLHDKRLLEKDRIFYHAPPGAKSLGDSGYQGVKDLNPLVKFLTPFKNLRNKKLGAKDKETNKVISSIRVKVEHPLAYLKHFAILAHTFRNQIEKSHQPFVNLACLYNFTRTHR